MELLSIISALVAISAALVSLWALLEQRRSSKLSANTTFLLESQKMLLEDPQLLNIHNIDIKELEESKITHSEFIYILNSFYAGQTYYFVEKTKKVKLYSLRVSL